MLKKEGKNALRETLGKKLWTFERRKNFAGTVVGRALTEFLTVYDKSKEKEKGKNEGSFGGRFSLLPPRTFHWRQF